jgi:hypothetical protein
MKTACVVYPRPMIVVKTQDYNAAISRIIDTFVNMYLGAEVYRDGAKLPRPVPGYPKIQTDNGVQLDLRLKSSPYYLIGVRTCTDNIDVIRKIAVKIARRVNKIIKNSRTPKAYCRAHVYGEYADEINIKGVYIDEWDPRSSNRVGVLWDYHDCTMTNDGDVITKWAEQCQLRYAKQITERNFGFVLNHDSPGEINYMCPNIVRSTALSGDDTAVPNRQDDMHQCNICAGPIIGLAFISNTNSCLCLGCRLIRRGSFDVIEMTKEQYEMTCVMEFVKEFEDIIADMRTAK